MLNYFIYYFLYFITFLKNLFRKKNIDNKVNLLEDFDESNYRLEFISSNTTFRLFFNKQYYNPVLHEIDTFNHTIHKKYIINADISLKNGRKYDITNIINSYIIPYYHFYNYIDIKVKVKDIIDPNIDANHVDIMLDFDNDLVKKKIPFDYFLDIKLLNFVITCATYKNIL